MQDLEKTRRTRDGEERLIQLFPATPSPADEFIPKEDTLNLLLRYAISNRESQKSVAELKKRFQPELNFNPQFVKANCRRMRSEGQQWFIVEYHCYSMDEGIRLYEALKSMIFS